MTDCIFDVISDRQVSEKSLFECMTLVESRLLEINASVFFGDLH